MRNLLATARSQLGLSPSVSNDRRTVLITGCSTGIGRSTAHAFLRRGWTVIATARRLESISELEQAGCHCYQLDVTDERSIQEAFAAVEGNLGVIDVLVNNAGYGVYGPVEQLSRSLLTDQFETNVFGLVRLSQMVLPGMRGQQFGRIINVSSIAGRFTVPMGGAYHASKHAVEAFSDAMRCEVEGFGIAVSLVEPGPVLTRWEATAISSIDLEDDVAADPYGTMKLSVIAGLTGMTEGRLARFASTPEGVARVIVRAARARQPKSRYRVGFLARFLLVLRWILPDALFDPVVARGFASR